jgi:hypothetical protein
MRPNKSVDNQKDSTPFEEVFEVKTGTERTFEVVENTVTKPEKKKTQRKQTTVQENQDEYMGTMVSITRDLNNAMDLYIAEMKAQGVKLFDPVHQKDRKISKSSWIAKLIEIELQKKGKI